MAHSYYTDCNKGEYVLMHPEKYMPNVPPPVYKSTWERNFFVACDMNPFVTLWAYEPPQISIAYMSPVYMKQAIYKPDVYLECQYPDGQKGRYLVEIKPVAYSVLPKAPTPPAANADKKKWDNYNKRKASYERKSKDVLVNYAKWDAAANWCKLHGVNWFLATEANMGPLFGGKTKK